MAVDKKLLVAAGLLIASLAALYWQGQGESSHARAHAGRSDAVAKDPGPAAGEPGSQAGPLPPAVAVPVPVGVERVDSAQAAPSELPESFFGPAEIVGIVRDGETGLPRANVRVSFIPGGFDPAEGAESERFDARTDGEGTFRLSRMPRARIYSVRAVGKFRMLRRMVPLAEVEAGPVLLLLSRELHYERFDLFDSVGKPVDASAATTTAAGAVVAATTWGKRELGRLRESGFAFESLPGNAIVHVYREAKPPIFEMPDGARVRPLLIRVPGFRAIELDTFRWPASRWPQAKRLTLERMAGAVTYRVRFPDMTPDPSFERIVGDAALELTLEVRTGADPTLLRHMVTATDAEFVGPSDATLEIRIVGIEGAKPLVFDRSPDGEVVLIEPRYPPLAFVVLRYEIPADVDPERPGVEFQVERGNWTFAPQKIRPGVAHIGPVPPGEYVVRRIWNSAAKKRWVADQMPRVAFRQGYSVIDWKN